jgi:hypothetical protein
MGKKEAALSRDKAILYKISRVLRIEVSKKIAKNIN